MNPYRVDFGTKKRVFPVIHILDEDQVRRNAEICIKLGVDGIFLIEHGASSPVRTLDLFDMIKELDGNPPVGINLLDTANEEALLIAGEKKIDFVWSDNAGSLGKTDDWLDTLMDEHKVLQTEAANTIYFGGFAFKYQAQPGDFEGMLLTARGYIDVITTSGEGTGQAADLEKLATMRSILGDHPLASASGVTPDNAPDQFRYIDAALVATGIGCDHNRDEIDEDKLERLIDVARSF